MAAILLFLFWFLRLLGSGGSSQSIVAGAVNPRGAQNAGDWDLRAHRIAIAAYRPKATVTNLEDFSEEPPGRDGIG